MANRSMQAFAVLWFGQMISIIGSAMTWFAFTIWVWEKTEQAASLALVGFFTFLPSLLFSPFAGAFVDRWNRKLTLMFSDMASAIATIVVFLIYISGSLELWHIYILGLLTGVFTAFQYPAYITVATLMVPKEHYARAEGMMGLAHAFSGLLAPILAAILLSKIGMEGIMLLDLLTFLFAFGALLWIRIPPRTSPEPASPTQSRILRDVSFGFRYIHSKPSLRALIGLFMFANFFLAVGATLMAPLILSQTGDKSLLAGVQSSGAFGGIAGGTLLGIWGGPKKRMNGILLGGVGACLLGVAGLGVGRSVIVWGIASFLFAFFEPFVEGGNLAIWQSKVDVDIQGRVLSARRLLVQVPYLFGMAASGWLADHLLFENNFSVLLVLAGLIGSTAFLVGFIVPPLRDVERILPDKNLQFAEGT
ncbi:MAG: MFS transporter [Anaerolineaceae bacterium]|nr:MAG: MFS transporter [Anaerolineaceae bacterium]